MMSGRHCPPRQRAPRKTERDLVAKRRRHRLLDANPCLLQTLEPRVMLSAVTLTGTGGIDSVVIEVLDTDMVVTINGTPNTFAIAGTESITLNTGAGDDEIYLDGSAVPITINSEAGNDQLILTELSGTLDDIAAPVTFNGGIDQDFLLVWDDLAAANGAYTITADTIDRTGFSLLTFAQTEAVELRAQAGDNSIAIESLANGIVMEVFAGDGNDTFVLANAGGTLDPLEGFLTVHGGEGIDALELNDRNNSFDDTWTVDDDTVIRDFWFGATYTTMEQLTINAGFEAPPPGAQANGRAPKSAAGRAAPAAPVGPRGGLAAEGEFDGSNTFNIELTSGNTPIVINAGAGNDVINLAAISGNLDSIASPVTVNGEAGFDAIFLDDRSNFFDDAFTITPTTISRLVFGGLTYLAVEDVTLNAGSAAAEGETASNAITITGIPVNTSMTINAGGGDDTVTVGAGDLAAIGSLLTVNGEGGDDALIVDDQAATAARNYTVNANSLVIGFAPMVSFGGMEAFTLNASAGANTIVVPNTLATMPVTIDAGAGDDTITVEQTSPAAPVTLRAGLGADTVNVNPGGAGSAQVVLDAAEDLQQLNIGASARVTIAAGAGATRTVGLAIIGNGTLDITDNALVVDYIGASPLAAVRGMITTGYASGAWTGTGITSSTAAATPNHAVGYAEASAVFTAFPATFAGLTVDDTAVLVRYTRHGDTNLDQTVNLIDFNKLAANFGGGNGLWSQGNFNFDQTVNLLDFNRLAANFGQSASAAAAADEDAEEAG